MNDKGGTQFWGKRKPMTKYFEGGYTTFSVNRKTGELWFERHKYVNEGTTLILDWSGIVENKEHLDKLLSYEIPNRNLEKIE